MVQSGWHGTKSGGCFSNTGTRMLMSLRALACLSHTVTLRHGGAALWDKSSQSRQFHCMSLGVANLCPLMVDLISQHSLVTRSCLGWIRDNEVLWCGWEVWVVKATIMRPVFWCGLKALPREVVIVTPVTGHVGTQPLGCTCGRSAFVRRLKFGAGC